MLIDWFTVAAQIINFLVLVWLLKRFLYARILRAIDEREGRIAGQLADAETTQTEARGQLAAYEAKLKDIEAQRDGLLAQAKMDAERQHGEMVERARRDVTDLESKWQEDLDRNREAFLLNLRRRAATQILNISRRVIADLTSNEHEQCATQVFLQKIRSLDREVWKRFDGRDLSVRSALELTDEQRGQILHTLQERIGTPVPVRFEQSTGIGLGLELRGNGWRIGWNSDGYLECLEEDLNEALTENSGASAMAAKTAR